MRRWTAQIQLPAIKSFGKPAYVLSFSRIASYLLLFGMLLSLNSPSCAYAQSAHVSRVLKFSGVPVAMAPLIKRRYPYVFEREVTLGEVDQIMRFLMTTGAFSNIEVVERDTADGKGRETVLVASILRKILDIQVSGNSAMSTSEILRILNVIPGQPFERKDLLNSADDLRMAYQRLGFHNTKVEIEFELPNDNEVRIKSVISEGQPLKIIDASVETPNKELLRNIGRMAHRLKDKILTDDTVLEFQKSVSDYFSENRFLLARLSDPAVTYSADRTQAKLMYGIENPWKLVFHFQGNSAFSNSSITKLFESDRLAGATASPVPDMVEKIRRMYQAVGFANVEVEATENKNETDFEYSISFKIKENARVRIQKIEIAGNVSRPAEYYSQFIKSSSSDLIGQGYYNKKDIDDGCKKLVGELQNQGYLRAKIQSSRAEYSKDKTNATVYLTVDEGPLTQIRQIRLEGAEAFPKAQLIDLLKIKSGAALSLKDLEDSIQLLKDFYHSQGFLEMKITNENERNHIVIYNETNTQATVDFQIYEGPKVIVSSIALQGNSYTKDHVIMRELTFKVGDTLTPEKINETIYHLQQLGLFSKVTIRTLEDGTSIADRTVIIEVADRDPGLFTIGFGANNERSLTFRGYLGVAYRNLQGTGRAISFRADPKYSTDPRISYVEHRITISYLEPFLFGERNRGRVNLVRDVSVFDFEVPPISPTARTIMQEENSIGFLIERELARHIKLTYTVYNLANQLQFDRQTYNDLSTQNIATTGPLLELDYRDDIFNPTKGSYTAGDFAYSDPVLGSSKDATQTINFIKTTLATTLYSRVNKRSDLVWANSVRGGYLANISPMANGSVPSNEAFFLGGLTTVRGFDATERFPNLLDLGIPTITKFHIMHDSYYYLLKTELRFPLVHSWNLGGAIFYDGGAVLISGVDLPTPYRDSVGIGLRITTPVGPVNIEYGWKLNRRLLKVGNPDIRESPGAFHFSIGTF